MYAERDYRGAVKSAVRCATCAANLESHRHFAIVRCVNPDCVDFGSWRLADPTQGPWLPRYGWAPSWTGRKFVRNSSFQRSRWNVPK